MFRMMAILFGALGIPAILQDAEDFKWRGRFYLAVCIFCWAVSEIISAIERSNPNE